MQTINSDDISGVVESTLSSLKNILVTNLSVGDPIRFKDDYYIVPISKINVGCLTGGAKINEKTKNKKVISLNNPPLSGGSGTGFSITPVGFICFCNGDFKYINCNDETTLGEDIVNVFSKSLNKIMEAYNEKEDKNEK